MACIRIIRRRLSHLSQERTGGRTAQEAVLSKSDLRRMRAFAFISRILIRDRVPFRARESRSFGALPPQDCPAVYFDFAAQYTMRMRVGSPVYAAGVPGRSSGMSQFPFRYKVAFVASMRSA